MRSGLLDGEEEQKKKEEEEKAETRLQLEGSAVCVDSDTQSAKQRVFVFSLTESNSEIPLGSELRTLPLSVGAE